MTTYMQIQLSIAALDALLRVPVEQLITDTSDWRHEDQPPTPAPQEIEEDQQ